MLNKCWLFTNPKRWVIQGRGKYYSEQLNSSFRVCLLILDSNSFLSMLILPFPTRLAFLPDRENRSKIGIETFYFPSIIHPLISCHSSKSMKQCVTLSSCSKYNLKKSLFGCHEQYLQDSTYSSILPSLYLW